MPEANSDERFLLALLNTTPMIDGVPADNLADPAAARTWLLSAGGAGTDAELGHVRQVRALLQAVVRGQRPPAALAPALQDVVKLPELAQGTVSWRLSAPPDRRLAVRAVLTWDALAKGRPGRLRPCANGECRLFLIDRSRAGTARWCSMAMCGNRMKARRHYLKSRSAPLT